MFNIGVIVQISYLQVFQTRQVGQVEKGHNVISDYLSLEERERKILLTFENIIDRGMDGSIQDEELTTLKDSIKLWLKQLLEWQMKIKEFVSEPIFKEGIPGIDDQYTLVRKRQVTSYNKAIELLTEKKVDEAKMLLNIENSYRPPLQEIVVSILGKISRQHQYEQRLSRRFFISTVFAVLLTLVVLTGLSIHSFGTATRCLKTLAQGANLISKGNFDELIRVKGPKEFENLAENFNHMQSAIKDRDQQIQIRTDEIEKLNHELEDRVKERNKTIEQQNLILSQKNNELEQILYTASHDLRTPLISIQGFGQELKMHCEDIGSAISINSKSIDANTMTILEQDIPVALNFILNGSKRMEMLLDGLLRITRLGRGSLSIEELDMNQVIENVKSSLSFQMQEVNAELKVENLCRCKGDASMLEQVFSNLISNSIKYRITNKPCEIKISSEKTNDHYAYHVIDNGIGISQAHIDKIFQAFYRIEEDNIPGEGLGLAIVKRIADLHNGTVEIKSALGEGTQITIIIPKEITLYA